VVATIDNELLVDRRRKITAGERVVPTGEMSSDAGWTALEASRIDLKALVSSYEGRDISSVMLPHPILGPINAFQWFVFIGTHEARHAAQITEIGRSL
jgi:hypothetical protein